MTKVTNHFDLFLANIAKKQAKLWHFAREWRSMIIVSLLAKLVTMAISVFAGYYFFYSYTLTYFESEVLAIGTTVVCLLLLELLTNITLSKTFKFAFNKKWLTATGCAVGAVLLFLASFQVTCNGWALKEGENIDASMVIEQEYNEKEAAQKADISIQIADIKKQMATIEKNPLGWSGYKRTKLTDGQLEKIFDLNAKLSDLRVLHSLFLQELTKNKKKALEANKMQIQQEASKYYNIAAYIMVAQIIFSALLTFFWVKIHKENQDEKEVLSAEVIQMRREIKGQMWDTLQTDLRDFSRQLKYMVTQPIELQNESITDSTNGVRTDIEEVRTMGFQIGDRSNESGSNPSANPQEKEQSIADLIAYLDKHKEVVQLLETGLSVPQIIQKTNVGRTTIFNVKRCLKTLKAK